MLEETNYPFDEEIHFTIHCEEPVSFPLSFRIPAWCTEPHFFLNERQIPLPPIQSGFARLKRKFHPGDKITLVLPMKAAVSHWPDNGIGVEHGPLVYSLPIKEDWSPVITPRYSTAEFPDWNATPATQWNYGLAIDEAKLNSEILVERKKAIEDPWINSPITLTVNAKRIAEWDLSASPDNTDQKFTPSLPTVTANTVEADPERIALVPYGATQLRVTILPNARPDRVEDLKLFRVEGI